MIRKALIGFMTAVGAGLFGVGVTSMTKKAVAISIIGGADGPTSVFLAGKIGDRFWWMMMLAGAAIVGLSVALFAFLVKKDKN